MLKVTQLVRGRAEILVWAGWLLICVFDHLCTEPKEICCGKIHAAGKDPALATLQVSHHSAVGLLPPCRHHTVGLDLPEQGAGSHLSHPLLQGRGEHNTLPSPIAPTSSSPLWPAHTSVLGALPTSPHVMLLPRGSSHHHQSGPIPLRPLLRGKDSSSSLQVRCLSGCHSGSFLAYPAGH